MPTPDGNFSPVVDVLNKNDKVLVKQVAEWQKSGYMWAKIEYEN